MLQLSDGHTKRNRLNETWWWTVEREMKQQGWTWGFWRWCSIYPCGVLWWQSYAQTCMKRIKYVTPLSDDDPCMFLFLVRGLVYASSAFLAQFLIVSTPGIIMHMTKAVAGNARTLSCKVGIHNSSKNVPQVLANALCGHFESLLSHTETDIRTVLPNALGAGSTTWLLH